MAGNRGQGNIVQKAIPYIAMIFLVSVWSGMDILGKISLNRGMSYYVLVVYRQVFATVSIAPFVLVFERGTRPKITLTIFMQMFALGLLGPVIDQNCYYAGLKFTSPTLASAISNMLPAMTFVLAVLCRMERVNIKKVRCQAKVVGTVVTVAGAMLMTLYKGHMVWSKHIDPRKSYAPETTQGTHKDWVKGAILLIIATFAWASFFILWAFTLRKYTAHLSLTALVCFMGTLQSAIVTIVMEHRRNAWAIGWDINLFGVAYAGILSTSISYYVQGLVMEKRGPVFATAFSPLYIIIVAIMASFILAEKIYVGGVVGAVIIIVGLYSVLWGKSSEDTEDSAPMEEPLPMIATKAGLRESFKI